MDYHYTNKIHCLRIHQNTVECTKRNASHVLMLDLIIKYITSAAENTTQGGQKVTYGFDGDVKFDW